MAEIIIIEGKSGTGKSTSLRNMPVEDTVIITPNTKTLPFQGGDKRFSEKNRLVLVEDMKSLGENITKYHDAKRKSDGSYIVKYLVIEDFTHYFVERITSNKWAAMSTGGQAFERYTDLARDVMQQVFTLAKNLSRKDFKIIVLHHTEENSAGYHSFRIFGNLLRERFEPVGYVTKILHTRVIDKENPAEKYVFQTNDDGVYQAKTPMGMFDEKFIPNDLYAVLQRIEEYDNPKVETETK